LNRPGTIHLGIDFDNTLVRYDELFFRCALDRGLVPSSLAPTKSAVRAHLWGLPDGNTAWTALQGVVYGERMAEAEASPGVRDFLLFCRDAGHRVTVISHKQEFPALGPRVNLRDAARKWLSTSGLLGPDGAGLEPGAVYFEATRDEKIRRVSGQRCTHYIDDLPEVFADPGFPPDVVKLLYAPDGTEPQPGVRAFRDWLAVRRFLEETVPCRKS
jgi:hypothetical protein